MRLGSVGVFVSGNSSGVATLSTASHFVGRHNVTATYPGDFNFDTGTSNVLVRAVTGYPTTTVLNSASPMPGHAFSPTSLVASVSSAFGAPTGTVTFWAGSKALATATVNASGMASATVITLGAGTFGITAVYNASIDYAGSTSSSIKEIVLGRRTSRSRQLAL